MTTHEETGTAKDKSKDKSKDKRVWLTIEITSELQQRIERAAAERNQRVQGYAEAMLEQLVPQAQQERAGEQERQGGISLEVYSGLLALQRKIAEEHPGHVFEDSVEVIHQMREERTRHLESLIRMENE